MTRLTNRRGALSHGFLLPYKARLTGQSGKLTVERSWDLLPYSQRVRGVNVALGSPSLASVVASGTPTPWAQLWTDWDTVAIQRRLDEAVTLGCNTVRMPGTVLGITGGYLTRASYLAKWDQLSGWCQSRKLFLYPYLADYFNESSPLSDTTTLQTEIVAAATHLNGLPDIIGLDLVQECDSWIGLNKTGTGAAASLAIYTAVKQVTTLPCTYSRYSTGLSTVLGVWSDRTDFDDCHIYYTPTNSDLTTAWSGGLTAPVLVGEYGTNPAAGSAAQVSRLNEIVTLTAVTGSGGRQIAGSLRWAVEDYDTVSNNQHGIFDTTGTEKTTEGAVFRTLPR